MPAEVRVTPGRGAAVTGWGTALPDTVVTNAHLAARLDTSDEWITARSGIRERRVGGSTSQLATDAARRALACAGLRPGDVDQLVLATMTPDQAMPATSAAVQDTLGLGCGAFDLNVACSGFVYALLVGHGLVRLGMDRVLVVGADCMSRVTDPDDRTTAVLFGDGAGAVVLEVVPGEGQLLGWDTGSDGSARSILYADHGGRMVMEGQEVFRRAVRATVASSRSALERAKVAPSEVALFVPHQANARIIESAAERIGIDCARVASVVGRTGNTSAASIPLALAHAVEERRVHDGDVVLLSGFGAGMSWASAVLRWGP